MPPAPPWTNQDLHLYHGTSLRSANDILEHGVDLRKCTRDRVDFGRGFYCTTIPDQARRWAVYNFGYAGGPTALVKFRVSRDQMALLSILPFVSANQLDQDFWSLFYFRRRGGQNHGRTGNNIDRPYDIVCGPVVLVGKKILMKGADQISFHTPEAQNLLNMPGRRSIIRL